MGSPTRTSQSRFATVAWAATVLALLVLPAALSAGQDGADPATDPPASQPTTPGPPATPPPDGQQGATGGGGGTGSDQGAGEPAGGEAPEPASTAITNDAPAAPVLKSKAKAAGSLTVSVGDNFYSPRSVSIDAGDTITWRNNGVAQHSATANNGSFDTGVFGAGASRSHTFSQAGTFSYFCTVHGQSQSGTVTVASTGGGGGGGGDEQSEAAAVASEGAAGSSSALPSTGSNALPPMVIGLLLLLSGLALRFRNWFGPA